MKIFKQGNQGGFTLFSARRSKEMLKELTRNKNAVFYDMELLS